MPRSRPTGPRPPPDRQHAGVPCCLCELRLIHASGSIPRLGFVTALSWRLEQRREKWFTEAVEQLHGQVDGLSLESLVGNDLFTDAVVTATRTVEHTHQAEKIDALRNAVLNSVSSGAPDADTQAIILNLIDRFTPSHLRQVTLWDDPPA
jgi:hypothetical protein